MSVKILIIDEDTALIRSLERTFDFCGYELLNAPDGMFGVQMAIRHQPNLIIMELQFPSGGAYFVLQNLKRSLLTRNIPVLILTGSADAAAKKKLLDFGFRTYLQKSSDRGELLARTVDLLGAYFPKPAPSIRKPVIASGDFKSSKETGVEAPETSSKLP
jgi:two-component system, cell cycle response regulator CtrA